MVGIFDLYFKNDSEFLGLLLAKYDEKLMNNVCMYVYVYMKVFNLRVILCSLAMFGMSPNDL